MKYTTSLAKNKAKTGVLGKRFQNRGLRRLKENDYLADCAEEIRLEENYSTVTDLARLRGWST